MLRLPRTGYEEGVSECRAVASRGNHAIVCNVLSVERTVRGGIRLGTGAVRTRRPCSEVGCGVRTEDSVPLAWFHVRKVAIHISQGGGAPAPENPRRVGHHKHSQRTLGPGPTEPGIPGNEAQALGDPRGLEPRRSARKRRQISSRLVSVVHRQKDTETCNRAE